MMRFFNRRSRGEDGTMPASAPGHAPQQQQDHHNRSRVMNRRERKERKKPTSASASRNSRPPVGQWFKAVWLDLLSFLIMGMIGLGVYFAKPAPSRSFPVYFQDGEVVYPQFAYPLRNEIVPIWLAALLGTLVPILFILIMQIKVRSFWDANNAIMGLLYSVISAAVFQVFVKWLIGGLRPHFLAVCKPAIPTGSQPFGNGFGHIMYQRDVCTGNTDEIDDSLESMPSGHSTAAFAGFVFLYLYLNGKLKVWSNYHPAYWKLVVTYMPILAACLIGGSLSIDEFHNWYDILAGAIIGTVFAFSAYRMVYASVWDFRFNHIPLSRVDSFSYSSHSEAFHEHRHTLFTRHRDEEMGGAPFDSSSSWTGHGHTSHEPHHRPSHEQRRGTSRDHGHTAAPMIHQQPPNGRTSHDGLRSNNIERKAVPGGPGHV